MKKINYSLRKNLIFGVITMGVVSVLLVVVTGHLYRGLAFDNQKNSLQEILGLKVASIIYNLQKISTTMGLNLQRNEQIRDAIKKYQIHDLKTILNQQFNRFYTSVGVIKLDEIVILNDTYEVIASTEKMGTEFKFHACHAFLERAKVRNQYSKLKPVSELCSYNGRPYHAVIVPVASLKPIGYLVLFADPSFNLRQVEAGLGAPIKIQLPNRSIEYQSNRWHDTDNQFQIAYALRGAQGQVILSLYYAGDFTGYDQQITKIDGQIIALTILVIAITLILVIYKLNNILSPLDSLKAAAIQLSKGKQVTVENSGCLEFDPLIKSFNQMALEITRLISQLQAEVLIRRNAETSMLQQKNELALARDQAYAATRAKSAFLANMSHELRTPLNAIIGYVEILLEEKAFENNQDAVDDLDKIRFSGQHLLSLINNILDLSKIEAGKMHTQLKTFELNQFISEIVNSILPLAEKNHNQMTLSMPDEPITVTTDDTKLRQIILNLLSNACKFTKNGLIEMTIESTTRNGDDWIMLTISDNGIGISEEQAQRLFNEFSQGDVQINRSYGGTGLGLALSQRYCDLIGGSITFNSEFGKGSEFFVNIPKNVSRFAYNNDSEVNFLSSIRASA